jgi:hypothetical protein
LLEGLKKVMKTFGGTGIPAEIRTEHLPDYMRTALPLHAPARFLVYARAGKSLRETHISKKNIKLKQTLAVAGNKIVQRGTSGHNGQDVRGARAKLHKLLFLFFFLFAPIWEPAPTLEHRANFSVS